MTAPRSTPGLFPLGLLTPGLFPLALLTPGLLTLGLLTLGASALGLPALAETLVLPEAEHTEALTDPYTRVTVTAAGQIEHTGRTMAPTAAELRVPPLVDALGAFHAEEPDGFVLLAGDRRADFRAVRAVLAAANEAGLGDLGFLAGPEGPVPRILHVQQRVLPFDPLAVPTGGVPLPPLTLHLQADSLVALRTVEALVRLPYRDGGVDLAALGALLDEDRRLHPSARLVVINTDDGVAYAQTFATLDRTRGKGYTRTLLAGGPAMESAGPAPTAPVPTGPVESFASVRLYPNGDTDLRAADGTVDLVRHDLVDRYEAHCDAAACDLVLRVGPRRVHIGARPRDTWFPDALFGRRVDTYTGRLGLPEPKREGVLSPMVPSAGEDPPDVGGAGGFGGQAIVLGALDKGLIDGVVKGNLDKLRGCYEELLDRSPTSRGKTTMKFVITADGAVSVAVVKASEIADPPFQACMAKTLRTLQFPKPTGGGIVIVSYPFVFTPG